MKLQVILGLQLRSGPLVVVVKRVGRPIQILAAQRPVYTFVVSEFRGAKGKRWPGKSNSGSGGND
jgi:nitrogen regulatory protein PII-like uncharacterized protein